MGIPVFLSATNLDAPIIAAIMASICSNTKSEFNFYIIDGFLSYANRKKLDACSKFFNNFTIEFIRMDLRVWIKKYPELSNFDKCALTKFALPTLRPGLDRAIVIDKDIIFLEGVDIENLFQTDLRKFMLAAVPLATMLGDGLWSKKKLENFAKLGLSSRTAVFDAGLMLIDVRKWNQRKTTDELLNITKELINEQRLFESYDGLFKLIDGQYMKLDKSWSVPYHYAKLFYFGKKFGQEDMRAIHYNYNGDNNKPWNNKELEGASYFWKYVKLTMFKYSLEHNPPSRIHDPQYWAKLKYRRKIINIIIKCLVNKKRYKKFKNNTEEFFADSKNRFICFLGEIYF